MGVDGRSLDKRSPSTSVTRVQFPYSSSRVGSVGCCCFGDFSPGSQVFLPPQKAHLRIPISSGRGSQDFQCSQYCRLTVPSINKVVIII